MFHPVLKQIKARVLSLWESFRRGVRKGCTGDSGKGGGSGWCSGKESAFCWYIGRVINEHDNSQTLIEFKRTVAGKVRQQQMYACCVSQFTRS
ncbi:hypothetical protein CDAR_486231 [Caerostris darwini]|uniref:Uncharacterized protein n=1 Tax=Caerostris darwini TaxID=1538125 RepID=A0AAV4MBE9_9ARAC|nr:hypothetical protein CDAR_486231 [Caerostris darwini]